MQKPARRFRYPLQVLLMRQSWDVDTLAAELAGARRALAQHEDELAALVRTADEVNRSLACMRTGDARLDLDCQRRLIDYRNAQDEAIVAKQQQLRSAQALCEQIGEQLARARRALKGYEKHSDRLRQAHASDAERLAAKTADDEWLMRRTAEEAAQ